MIWKPAHDSLITLMRWKTANRNIARIVGISILGLMCLSFRGCVVEPFSGLLINYAGDTTRGNIVNYYGGGGDVGYSGYEPEWSAVKYEYEVGGREYKGRAGGSFAETIHVDNNITVEYFTKAPSVCRPKGEGTQNFFTWFIFDYLNALPILSIYVVTIVVGLLLIAPHRCKFKFHHRKSEIIWENEKLEAMKEFTMFLPITFIGYFLSFQIFFPFIVLALPIWTTLKLTRELRLSPIVYTALLFVPGLNVVSLFLLFGRFQETLDSSNKNFLAGIPTPPSKKDTHLLI